jgi:hypothetical protein
MQMAHASPSHGFIKHEKPPKNTFYIVLHSHDHYSLLSCIWLVPKGIASDTDLINFDVSQNYYARPKWTEISPFLFSFLFSQWHASMSALYILRSREKLWHAKNAEG